MTGFLSRKARGRRYESADRLLELVSGQVHIDMLGLPELTKAYLGLCPQPFDEVL